MSHNMQRVYVALGCNLGQREQTLGTAIEAIEQLNGVSAVRVSSLYETDPMGPADQPDYLNAVCEFDTSLDAQSLLEHLQAIEFQHGRVRDGERWGPRTLDLDILLYAQQTIQTPTLIVPHAGIAQRSFVLLPLLELSPDILIPGLGPASQLIKHCPQFGIRRLA